MQYIRSICTLCHCGCGIIIGVQDNKMVSIQSDIDHPANRNYLCKKIKAIEEFCKSSDRLKKPLIRTKHGLKESSWENAYDFAAEKISTIMNKFGADSIMRCSGAPVSYNARDGFSFFMKAIGTANATGSSTYCMVPRVTAFSNIIGGKPEPDFDNSNYIIMWGSNPKATNRMGGYCAFNGIQNVLDRARKRNSTIIFIDPVKCESIKENDFWVKINPGSDIYLALGMIREIINNELHDKEFVSNYAAGFEQLKEYVQEFTPEKVEEQTGINQETIKTIATDFAKSDTALICEGNGLDMYCNTVYTVEAIATLCAITGRIDRKGGLVFLPFVPQKTINDLNPASMKQKYKYPLFRDIPFPAVKESLLNEEEDRPRAMIVHHANPALINSNRARTAEALRKLDFLLVSDIFLTATGNEADLVLPETISFESFGYKAYTSFDKPFVALQQPIFTPPEGMRSVFVNEFEIAKRIGIAEKYPYHDEISWINYALSPAGITFEDLKSKHIIFFDKQIVYEKYKTAGFRTKSGKAELYSTKKSENGYCPVPQAYSGIPNKDEDAEEYPFIAINYRPGTFVHTKLHNIKALTNEHDFPKAWLNEKMMHKYNLLEKTHIIVESKNGSVEFETNLKKDLDDNQIMIEFGWGNPTDGKQDINTLTNDTFFDPISGTTSNRSYRVKITKA